MVNNIWAVVASGASVTAEMIDKVRDMRKEGKLSGIIAVSNVGLDLMPDADALVSHDTKWWATHRDRTKNFKNPKYCRGTMTNTVKFIPNIIAGCNSGLMAMEVAYKIYNADMIILLGFDMHGTHYFGRHPEGLKNTTEKRFEEHIAQFDTWVYPCKVINCTPNSALKKFECKSLKEVANEI